MARALLVKLVVSFVALLMVSSLPLSLTSFSSDNGSKLTPAGIPQQPELAGLAGALPGSVGVSGSNIAFTGNVVADFAGHLVASNNNKSTWGATSNISRLYVAFNSTYLFIGVYENISSNSLYVFLSNNSGTPYGTTNITGLNTWSRNITFTSPINYMANVYSPNSGPSSPSAFLINSSLPKSNTSPFATPVTNYFKFGAAMNTTEIRIPWTSLFPYGHSGSLDMNISAFVVGSSGPWVGTGIPFSQEGTYNSGTQKEFTVNNSVEMNFGTLTVATSQHIPINLAIIYNNHQPLYKIVGSENYQLPWTEAHATAEYIEQPLISHMYPGVNVTYELSGSLLYQLNNVSSDPQYNNTYIEGAFVPWNSLNTSQNLTYLGNLTYDYFSIPGYVFSLGEPASNLYSAIHSNWTAGKRLNATQFEDVKVLWFLYDISASLVEGKLGAQWKNSTIWGMHNQTSFTQSDLVKILGYSKWLTGRIVSAFSADMMGNVSGSNNVELMTTPFYHPLMPLLATNNISGPQGSIAKGSYNADLLAQLEYGKGQFYHFFGKSPVGVWTPEAAVSNETVSPLNLSGYKWTESSEWTLQQSGVNALDGGKGGNVTQMQNLYTPYKVMGANGTSVTMFFRDDYLSDAWAFNYGNMQTSAAVANFINYLKGVYNAIPLENHSNTVVTVALDGENWMFMAPFANDGIPFLDALYAGLEANSSYIHTVTPQQYLSTHHQLPVIHNLATGSWNQGNGVAAPYQGDISLTQWSGYPVQDFYWEVLDKVRGMVISYQVQNGLTQLGNYTLIEQNLTASGKEGNFTRAMNAIYAAEGSDWFFTAAPWDISGSNMIPFDYIFKGDLIYALHQIGASIPDYLTTHPVTPYPASSMGQPTQAHTPTMGGYPETSSNTGIGTAFSVSSNNGWRGSTVYLNNSSASSPPGIKQMDIAYNPSTFYVQLFVNGNATSYIANSSIQITLYFSNPGIYDPSMGNVSFDVPGANYNSLHGNAPLDFPASYMILLSSYSFNSEGNGAYVVYSAAGFGSWNTVVQDTDTPAYVGQTIQFAIPFSYLGMVPGDTFYMAAMASTTPGTGIHPAVYSNLTPVLVTVPAALGKFYPIAAIHNSVQDNGPGNYTYPNQPSQIPNGSLDMQWINVSMNSYDMMWNFTFGQMWNIWNGPLGFSNQIVQVFINENNVSGSSSLGEGPNANVNRPWQYSIYLSGWAAYLVSSSGTQYTNGIVAKANLISRTVSIEFPLSIIGGNPKYYGYTIVSGSYDGYGTDGWRIVEQVNTSNSGWQGGGGDPPWSSNIYSYIAPATVGEGSLTQQQALTYSAGKVPTVTPIFLPLLNSSLGFGHFNYTSYNGSMLVGDGSAYYDMFISNVSGSNDLYFSSSGNMISWTPLTELSSISGVEHFSAFVFNGTMYVFFNEQSSTDKLSVAKISLSAPVSASILDTFNATFGILRISTVNNGTSGNFVAISNGSYVQLLRVSLTSSTVKMTALGGYSGVGFASLGQFGGKLYAALTNGSGVLFIDQFSTSGSLQKTVQVNTSDVTAFSLAISDYGNLWIAYANSTAPGSIFLVNSSLNGEWSFSSITTVSLAGSSSYEIFLLAADNGKTSNLIMTWGSASSIGNSIWTLNSTLSWNNVAIKQISTTTPYAFPLWFYVVIGAAVAAAIVAASYYLFIVRRKG